MSDKDRRTIGITQCICDPKPVEDRHVQVKYGRIWRERTSAADGLSAVVGGRHVEAGKAEQLGQRIGRVAVVVNHEDSAQIGRWRLQFHDGLDETAGGLG